VPDPGGLAARLLHAVACVAVFVSCLMPATSQAAELRSIGVSLSDMGNPFFTQIARGVEAEARRIGGPKVKVYATSCAYDLKRQIEQLNRFIDMKVDLIVLTAVDPEGVRPVVARAQAAGIRVLAVDVVAAGVDVTVMTDNVQAGRMACEVIAERLNGQGRVLIVNGPQMSSVTERVEGCMQVLRRHPGIMLLSSDRNAGGSTPGGFATMTELLDRFPAIDAVLTINDPTALGAERAAFQAGRREFFIVSVDGSPAVVARMRNNGSLIVATVAQRPALQASKAVAIGYELLNGVQEPAGKTILIPPFVVTARTTQWPEGAWR
jgi:ribose transport system substrate-binding protein